MDIYLVNIKDFTRVTMFSFIDHFIGFCINNLSYPAIRSLIRDANIF